MSIEVVEDCQLEWDRGRGIVYVRDRETGRTVLQVSNLPCVGDDVSAKDVLVDVRAQKQESTVAVRRYVVPKTELEAAELFSRYGGVLPHPQGLLASVPTPEQMAAACERATFSGVPKDVVEAAKELILNPGASGSQPL